MQTDDRRKKKAQAQILIQTHLDAGTKDIGTSADEVNKRGTCFLVHLARLIATLASVPVMAMRWKLTNMRRARPMTPGTIQSLTSYSRV